MKRPRRFLKLALVFSAIALASLAAVAWVPNDAFQFCTTKAYGFPFPWRVDYCLCEGGETVVPLPYITINLGLIAVSGLVSARVYSWWRPRPGDPGQR